MTCELCCSQQPAKIHNIAGRTVQLCHACIVSHLDFPRLAASLEAAKGRKCIDPSCEAHNPKPLRSLTAELKKVFPRPGPVTQEDVVRITGVCGCGCTVSAHDMGGKCRLCRCQSGPDFMAQVEAFRGPPRLCGCGHPMSDHWKDCGGCWKIIPGKTTDSGNCDCEAFTEPPKDALCTCGGVAIGLHLSYCPVVNAKEG